ncbi:hypothetical protein TWF132_008682 [Orbilia oligospora]|nr:hypothetical protein TWF132_008682 [Orbilia oligospora]
MSEEKAGNKTSEGGLTWFAGNHSQRILQGCDLFNWKNKGGRLILRQNKNKINKRYLGLGNRNQHIGLYELEKLEKM